jgi:hypothetical protein
MRPSFGATVDDDRHLQSRIFAEFGEMPGLKLTLRQAARLFAVEAARCERVLRGLVAAGSLCHEGELFTRAGDWRNPLDGVWRARFRELDRAGGRSVTPEPRIDQVA